MKASHIESICLFRLQGLEFKHLPKVKHAKTVLKSKIKVDFDKLFGRIIFGVSRLIHLQRVAVIGPSILLSPYDRTLNPGWRNVLRRRRT
jgi:hypothetical protein